MYQFFVNFYSCFYQVSLFCSNAKLMSRETVYLDSGKILSTLHNISSYPTPPLLDEGLRVFHTVSFSKVL